jgi:hypothetical protein
LFRVSSVSPVAAAAAAVMMSSASAALADGPNLPFAKVEMQGLDKVTARVSAFEAPVDGEVRFGTLSIRVRACLETPLTEAPESAAFLEIRDVGPSAGGDPGFRGWMFASSPALSALEHPVYDVWVVGCADPLPEPAPAAEPGSPAPAPPSSPVENG